MGRQRMINKQKYHRLMKEYQATGNVTVSAMRADVSRPTARKYLNDSKTPDELQIQHGWRTRKDPLEEVWGQAMAMLESAPELEARSLFEHLLEQHPSQIQTTHLRTFQRRVKAWRMLHGPDKEVFFPQHWKPGRALQLDWTNADELQVRIQGEPCEHLLCHVVLPYSNWDWAARCQSESLLCLRHGLQEGVHRLGRVPEELRVGNTTAATHQVGGKSERAFNPEFLSIREHYRMKPRTIGIGCPNENGDVESSNGHLKRRLNQHLILRTSRDFLTQADYQKFLEGVLEQGNKGRQVRLREELSVMQPLPPTRLVQYDELYCPVSSASTIGVKKVGYSVPARWIGSKVKVEVHESHLKVYSGRELLLTLPRRRGARHGSLEYLRLLKLSTEVEAGDLELMLVEFVCPPHPKWTVEDLRKIVLPRSTLHPEVQELEPEWTSYDELIHPEPEVPHVG